jgi:EpsD family peptidyl-prolyl cis-trans isomerase
MLLIAASLAGCGPRGGGGQDVVSGRDISITSAELEQVLTRLPPVAADQAKAARRIVLDRLVDEKLLARRALDDKLDKEPAVMQRIEAARRGILAAAYAKRAAATSIRPDPAGARAFYDANPVLFANRVIVELEEVELTGSAADLQRFNRLFMQSKGSLPALLATLEREGHPSATFVRLRTPEELPLPLARRFAALKPGQPVAYTLGSLNLAVVRRVEAAPIPFAVAQPTILKLIDNQHRATILKAELKDLRDQADLRFDRANLKRAGVTS